MKKMFSQEHRANHLWIPKNSEYNLNKVCICIRHIGIKHIYFEGLDRQKL